MRAFHLLGLWRSSSVRPRFEPTTGGALFLPAFVPAGNRAAIIAWYATLLAEAPLPIVEVDWDHRLLAPSIRFLERLVARQGPRGSVVVVRVRRPGVDLDDVAQHPAIAAFEWPVIASAHSAQHERVGRLRELATLLRSVLRELYDETALDVGCRGYLGPVADEVARVFLDPVEMANVLNHALELELREPAPEPKEAASDLRYRAVVEGLRALPPEALVCLLSAVAQRGDPAAACAAAGTDADRGWSHLATAGLVYDRRVVGWGSWLAERDDVRELTIAQLADQHRTKLWEPVVVRSLDWLYSRRAEPVGTAASQQLDRILGLVWAGQTDAAEAELGALTTDTLENPVYWRVVGELRHAQGELGLAEQALRRAVEHGTAPAHDGASWHALGAVLVELGRLLEAEQAFKRALELKTLGDAAPVSSAASMERLARVLRDSGRTDQAETLFRQVIHVLETHGATDRERGVALGELARLLRDSGRGVEAESMFAEALRLKESGGDNPSSLARTLENFAQLLEDLGRTSEAESMFRRAVELKRIGGSTPRSLGGAIHNLARTLRDSGRLAEAEEAFREALQLKESDARTPPLSLAMTFGGLALTLEFAKRQREAASYAQRALKLIEQTGGENLAWIRARLVPIAESIPKEEQ